MGSGTTSTGTVVSADELGSRLGADSGIVVVDCRFNLFEPHAGFHAYLKGHIPGARYAHLDNDLAARPNADQGRHPLPDGAAFRRFLGANGIGEDDWVVGYDDAGGQIAARLWWLLGYVGHGRRAILDGGLAAWTQAGRPLSTELPAIERREYPIRASLEPPPVATTELAAMDLTNARLVDVRAAERFDGDREPIDPVAGHVPGAINLPFSRLLNADGAFRDPEDLRGQLDAAGAGNSSGDVMAMCGSGVTACLLIAAADHAGLAHPRLYAGSWSEWIRDESRPIAGKVSGKD